MPKQYKTRDTLRKNVLFFHPNTKPENIKETPSAINPIIVEVDTGNLKNKRCTICERDYDSRASYYNHMNRTHKGGKREPAGTSKRRNVDATIIPIWDDHYCRSCK